MSIRQETAFAAILKAMTDISGDAHQEYAMQIQPNNALVKVAYDAVVETEPDTVTEVYTFKTGGASGTTVATVTLTYADSTKARLTTVVKT